MSKPKIVYSDQVEDVVSDWPEVKEYTVPEPPEIVYDIVIIGPITSQDNEDVHGM